MEIPGPQEFVRLVQERLGADQPAEIARRLGLTDYSAPQRVRRWMKGRNGPDYEGTMLMLRAAGWLAMDGDASQPGAGEVIRAADSGYGVSELLALVRPGPETENLGPLTADEIRGRFEGLADIIDDEARTRHQEIVERLDEIEAQLRVLAAAAGAERV